MAAVVQYQLKLRVGDNMKNGNNNYYYKTNDNAPQQ